MLLNHVGLAVRDLERSVAFYCDVLGLELLRRTEPSDSTWFRTLTDNPDGVIESAMLGLGDFRLQLVHYSAGADPAARVSHAAAGSPHLCLNVSDLDDRYQALCAAGEYQVGEVVDIAGTGNRSFYVIDPDGVPVELLQPLNQDRWP